MSSFTLSLQHTPDTVDPNETLPRLIERINQQSGFRNVSESTLLEEIRTAEAGQVTEDPAQENAPTAAQDENARLEEIYSTREELRSFIAQAHNDALTALDFISLLLSKDRPLQGGMTMSPALKQMVPAGSLGYVKFDPPTPSDADRRAQQDITTGWTLDSLDSAADKLLSSAQRLEATIEQETKYWEHVMSISAKGWSLSQMPGEPHTIGVRFGFAEAAPAFQARDTAALRPDGAGNILLDQRLATEPKAVRVQVVEGSRVTATARPTEVLPPPPGDADIGTQIRRARDALFEEELFYEMTREARTLLPYNVRVRDNAILLPLSTTSSSSEKEEAKVLRVDLVPLHHSTQATDSSNAIASLAALSLRILLSHAYRLKFARRITPPPPIPADPQPPPVLPILRPLLTQLHHASALSALTSAIHALQQKRHSSAEAAEISAKRSDETKAAGSGVASETDITTATSIVTVSFPQSAVDVCVTATTSLNPPVYGTSFAVTSSSVPPVTFTRTEDVLAYIASLLPATAKTPHSNETAAHANEEALVVESAKEDEKNTDVDADVDVDVAMASVS